MKVKASERASELCTHKSSLGSSAWGKEEVVINLAHWQSQVVLKHAQHDHAHRPHLKVLTSTACAEGKN